MDLKSIVSYRYPHFEEPAICYIQAFWRRNNRFRLVQGVRVNADGTSWIIRPRDYWGIAQAVLPRITLPDDLINAVKADARQGMFPHSVGHIPAANYVASEIRSMQSVPPGTTPIIAHIDSLLGSHLGLRKIADTKNVSAVQHPDSFVELKDRIAASPNDLSLRQNLADRYIELGDPLGSLIHVQCELSKNGLPKNEKWKLQLREHALLKADMQCRAEPILYSNFGVPTIRRGLVEELAIKTEFFEHFLDHAPVSVFRMHPALVSLSIVGSFHNDKTLDIKRFAKMKALNRIAALSWRSCALGECGALSIASSAFLGSLEKLAIYYDAIGDAGALALANCNASLSSLILFENEIGPEGVRSLTSVSTLSGLRELYIGENQIGDAGVRAIAESEYLNNLASLTLAYCDVGPDGLMALAASSCLTKLENLFLIGESYDERSRQALVDRFGKIVAFA